VVHSLYQALPAPLPQTLVQQGHLCTGDLFLRARRNALLNFHSTPCQGNRLLFRVRPMLEVMFRCTGGLIAEAAIKAVLPLVQARICSR
jgi:hypothetical protein